MSQDIEYVKLGEDGDDYIIGKYRITSHKKESNIDYYITDKDSNSKEFYVYRESFGKDVYVVIFGKLNFTLTSVEKGKPIEKPDSHPFIVPL